MTLPRIVRRHVFRTAGFLALVTGCGAGALDDGADAGEPIGDPVSAACAPGTPCEGTKPELVREVCSESRVGPPLLRRLTRGEAEATLFDVFPELVGAWEGGELSLDPSSTLGFANDASSLVVGGTTAKELLKTAESAATVLTSDAVLSGLLPCATTTKDAACVETFLNEYGMRLFRRPLTAEEVQRYSAHHQDVAKDSDFKMGLKWTLVGLIQSPQAFYRREIGTLEDGRYTLTPYELATELSYTYVGTTPDQALLDAAEAGKLTDPAERLSQAKRLLNEHPRKREVMREFFREWLEYTRVRGQSRVAVADFPVVAEKQIEETERFFDQVVFEEKGTVSDLLTADYTMMDDSLVDFYGFGTKSGAWSKTIRPADRGLGLLAQGSVLAGTAHQTETSPTLRGLTVYRRLFCNSRPKPPNVVPSIEETAGTTDAKTTREKYELHHSQGSCGTCHKNFEPFGYTFEHFDETGRYRETENGETINTTATVLLPDATEAELTSLEEVARLVESGDDIDNCVSGLLAAYLFSGAGGQNCLAEEARKKVAEGTLTTMDYILSLAEAPHFTTRLAPASP